MEKLLKMKKFLNRLKLIFRYAFKNIIFGKLKSLALLLTFTLIFVVVFLIISTRSFISSYYQNQYKTKYKDFDIVMTVNENSNARFFSIRKLDFEGINKRAAFFEVNTLLNFSKSDYVKVMMGSIDDLASINYNLEIDIINQNEIIITNHLAKRFNISLGDELQLQFDNSVNFKVIEIIEEDGLFSGSSVFIDKDSNMTHILQAFNLTSIGVEITKNLYNVVYIDTNSTSLEEDIKSIDDYKNLNITKTYSEEVLTYNINRGTAAFSVIFSFVLVAILLVLQSTLSIMFKERIKQIGVIKSIGGRSNFFLNLILVEVLFYLLISFVLGIINTRLLINIGFSFLQSNFLFRLSFTNIVIGTITVLFLVYIIIYINYYTIKKTSIVSLSKDNQVNLKSRSWIYFLVFLLLGIVNILFNSDYKLKALINAVIVIILGFIIVKLLLSMGMIFKRKNLFFFSLKNVNQNKSIFHNINILIISFFAIFLIVTSVNYNQRHNNRVEKELSLDYLITNVVHDIDDVVNEVKEMENVQSVDPAFMYRNISFNNTDIVVDFIMSIESNKVLDYLSLDIDDEVINKLNDKSKAYIVLPESYKYLYNYKLEDKITLNISKEYPSEEFEVGGFFKNNSSFLAITNMADLDKYSLASRNIIMVNELGDGSLYEDLINTYKSKLYYIVDFDITIDSILNETRQVVSYLNYVSYIFIICFILTIFNNSILVFAGMSKTYAKMRVLGINFKRLVKIVIIENMYLLLMVIITVVLMILGFIPNIKDIVLYFGVYFPLDINIKDLLQATIISLIIYIISYSYYFVRLSKLNLAEELKSI